jgi:hypothetical protein
VNYFLVAAVGRSPRPRRVFLWIIPASRPERILCFFLYLKKKWQLYRLGTRRDIAMNYTPISVVVSGVVPVYLSLRFLPNRAIVHPLKTQGHIFFYNLFLTSPFWVFTLCGL